MASPMPEPLAPSSLGTKEYWDALYQTEQRNALSASADDADATSTVWFSDANAEEKMIDFLSRLLDRNSTTPANCSSDAKQDSSDEELDNSRHHVRMLDLGTGNGHMLFALQDAGFSSAELVGVDYSAASVVLAEGLRDGRDSAPASQAITFAEWDITTEPGSWVDSGFDVVLDKGTFDAMSLSGGGTTVGQIYKQRVIGLLKEGGWFLVTSCNWTEAELRAWLEGEGLEFADRIRYPTFRFGGKTGQSVTSVCFRRTPL